MSDEYDLASYDFDLPTESIAQVPPAVRGASRMLVLDRQSGVIADRSFEDIADLLNPGDVLVVNNTRVIPARLFGSRRPGGGRAELFLVRREALGRWVALGRPGKRLVPGTVVDLPEGGTATIEDVDGSGRRRVTLQRNGEPFASEDDESAFLDVVGRMPLPPYIERTDPDPADRERYQTVYAAERGAIAAPTAGLHFTADTFDRIRERGIAIAEVTLHVGYGTFEPVRTDDLRSHSVAAEEVEIRPDAAETINRGRSSGGRVLSVGTTSTRALESAHDGAGRVRPFRGPTDLTILPGSSFEVVDAMLTNFHLPRSSLLVLVSAFAGRERVLNAYRHAVASGYRFYSYGDCMLIV